MNSNVSHSSSQCNIDTKQLVVISPGSSGLNVMAAIARGLNIPFAKAATVYCRTPATLIKNLSEDEAVGLQKIVQNQGLETLIEDNDKAIELPKLYEAALRIKSIERLPQIIETLSQFLGLDSQKVYQLLATIPGAIIGNVSYSSLMALAEQLGESAELISVPLDESRYDLLWYPKDTLPTGINQMIQPKVMGDKLQWLELGMSKEDTSSYFKQFAKGCRSRFVNRAFLRFDLVLRHKTTQYDQLHRLFGIPKSIVEQVAGIESIALSSELDYQSAKALRDTAIDEGIEVALSLPELYLCDLEIQDAPSKQVLQKTLQSLQLPVPSSLPESVAFELVDLDARILQHQLHSAGIQTRFVETKGALR